MTTRVPPSSRTFSLLVWSLARRPYLPAIIVCALLFALNGVLQPRTLRPESIVADIATYLPLILLAVGQTYVVFAGLALWVLPQAGLPTPDRYWETYGDNLAGVPFVLWVLTGVAGAVALIARLVLGRQLMAVGGHMQSAYQSGLPVPRLRIQAYMLCGLFAALAALCLTGDTASGDPLLGAKSTLGSVAAVVLGGTALSGGRGSAVGSIFGAIILGLVGSVVFFAGVPFEFQNLVQGLIVLAALAGGVLSARGT